MSYASSPSRSHPRSSGAPPNGWPRGGVVRRFRDDGSAVRADPAAPPPARSRALVPAPVTRSGWDLALGGAQTEEETRELAWRAVVAGEEAEVRAEDAEELASRAARDLEALREKEEAIRQQRNGAKTELKQLRQLVAGSSRDLEVEKRKRAAAEAEAAAYRKLADTGRQSAAMMCSATRRGRMCAVYWLWLDFAKIKRRRSESERHLKALKEVSEAECARLREDLRRAEGDAAERGREVAEMRGRCRDNIDDAAAGAQQRDALNRALSAAQLAEEELGAELRRARARLRDQAADHDDALAAQRRELTRERAAALDAARDEAREAAAAARDQLVDLQQQDTRLRAQLDTAKAAQAAAESDAARAHEELRLLRAAQAAERRGHAEAVQQARDEAASWRRTARDLQQQMLDPAPPAVLPSPPHAAGGATPRSALTPSQRWGGVAAMADGSRRAAAAAAPLPPLTAGEASLLAELAQRGDEWLRRNWWPALGPIHRADANPGLTEGCPAARRFLRGLSILASAHGGTVAAQRRLLAQGCWGLRSLPGSTIEERSDALGVVCHWGWGHPASRDSEGARDAVGSPRRGAAAGQLAHCLTAGVGDGGERAYAPQLLSFILRGAHYSLMEGAAHSVVNPADGAATYDVPVLAVAYGDCLGRPRFAR